MTGAGSLELRLAEQVAYYRARAGEYDDWWYRRGRYDHGLEATAAWRAEAAQVEAALDALAPHGDVLELACGTGLWTARLAPRARSVLALDAAPEVLIRARERLSAASNVELAEGDLFAWRPQRRYDLVFFGFWLSHVPAARFADFWELVRAALAPEGRFFLVDSLRAETSSARDHGGWRATENASETGVQRRRLADGREFEVVKVYHSPAGLAAALDPRGFESEMRATPTYFLYGSGRKRA